MVEIVPNADINKLIDSLDGLEKAGPRIKKTLIRKVAVGSKKHIRKGFDQHLKKRSGETRKSIKHKVYKDGHATLWMAKRSAYPLIVGATILPKNGNYLYFTGDDGKLRRLKSVTLVSRPFFQPPLDDYFTSDEPVQIMQKNLEKEIEKQWKRQSAH